MIAAGILGTGSALPARAVSTEELLAAALPDRDPIEMARRIGVRARHFLDERAGESAASIGADALGRALEAAALPAGALRRIVFVSSTGGDHLIPATANSVAERLGLDDTCDAFDLNNSCAGFVSALDVAARSVATGLGPCAVVVAETFSRYLAPARPRPFLVLGDAAAAVVIGEARAPGEGLLASHLRNSAALRGRMTTRHPGVTRAVETIEFAASSEELADAALDAIGRSSAAALEHAGLAAADVDWWLPHQPNGELLERIASGLGIDRARMVNVVEDVGSVGAASIPLSLDRLLRSGRLRARDVVLMAGVGSGTGYGAIAWRVGA
jgi:3-oxoacyl-(acyl-carrier-protein) synthase III